MFSKLMKTHDPHTLVFRLAALTAIVGSCVALAGHLLGSQCDTCTARSGLLGTAVAQLPWLGLVGALSLMVLSFGKGVRATEWRINLSLAGGGVGLGLLLLQAVVFRALCPTCCLVNAAFVLAAFVEAIRARRFEPAQ